MPHEVYAVLEHYPTGYIKWSVVSTWTTLDKARETALALSNEYAHVFAIVYNSVVKCLCMDGEAFTKDDPASITANAEERPRMKGKKTRHRYLDLVKELTAEPFNASRAEILNKLGPVLTVRIVMTLAAFEMHLIPLIAKGFAELVSVDLPADLDGTGPRDRVYTVAFFLYHPETGDLLEKLG